MNNASFWRCVAAGFAALLCASCGASAPGSADRSQYLPAPVAAASMPIKHIVIVVQENRSFDNFFSGYPGADSATSGQLLSGKTIKLRAISFAGVQLDHSYAAAKADWNGGKMNGWIRPEAPPVPPVQVTGFPKPSPDYMYSYVKRSLVAPYWAMAQHYVLADHMFPTEWGASFTGHQMLIAGSTSVSPTASLVDIPNGGPWDCNYFPGTTTSLLTDKGVYEAGAGPPPCLSYYPTIADALDAGKISWKEYFPYTSDTNPASIWNMFLAIKKIFDGPDKANVIMVPGQILVDAKAGNLPGVSWVIPDFQNSDHSNAGSDTGPSWVASIVNAVGEGPDWKSTAIIVIWDDWGGWYDHANPPQLDYLGLSERVPCLIISPYAKAGHVSHTQYEFASTLKTIEQVFNLKSIGTTDVRATGMLDGFDFTKPARPFEAIPSKYPIKYFLRQTPSDKPVDDE